MRLTAFTYTSRRGIFYFCFPLSSKLHRANKRGHIKVSMRTRLASSRLDHFTKMAGQAASAPTQETTEILARFRAALINMLKFADQAKQA